MMVAMLFESAGRESEVGGKDAADVTRGYKEASVASMTRFVTAFEQASGDHGLLVHLQDVADSLMCVYEMTKPIAECKGKVAEARRRLDARADRSRLVATSRVFEV